MQDPALDPASAIGTIPERTLVARIRHMAGTAPEWLRVGIGDDAAVIQPVRNELDVVTTDIAVEGVHFDRAFTACDAIGHRALAANLSDLAAMGASPRYATLSIAAPLSLVLSELDALVGGFLALAAVHRVALVGGNLSRSPGPLIVDVLAAGTVRPRRVLTRGGARPGDLLFVSGALGAARAGLDLCRRGITGADEVVRPREHFLRPAPRVRLGLLLARTRTASACMDLSDGLADAASQVAEASGVGLEIDANTLPVGSDVRQWAADIGLDAITEAVRGGDDYELLFTVSPRRQRRLREVAALVKDVPITRIGVVTHGGGAVLQRNGAVSDLTGGFSHFGAMGSG